MHFVTRATTIDNIDDKSHKTELKSRRNYSTNHRKCKSCHLGDRNTHTHTHTHICTCAHESDFKKPRFKKRPNNSSERLHVYICSCSYSPPATNMVACLTTEYQSLFLSINLAAAWYQSLFLPIHLAATWYQFLVLPIYLATGWALALSSASQYRIVQVLKLLFIYLSFPYFSLHLCTKTLVTPLSFILSGYTKRHLN